MPGHYPPWASFESQWLAALGCGVIALSAAHAGRSNVVRWPSLAWLAIATAVVPPLQWSVGQVLFAADALLPAMYLLAFGLCIAAGATMAQARGAVWLDGLFAALTVAGMVSVVLALAQWLSIESGIWVAALPPGGRPFANLGQPNHLATLLGLALVGVLRAYERHKLGSATAALCAAWLGLGLVMTQSRTGWLFVALLAIWAVAMSRRAALRLRPLAVFAGAGLFAVAVVAWEPLNAQLLMQQTTSLEQRLEGGPRSAIWKTLFEASIRSPWLGYGWNQVILAQQAVAVDVPPVRYLLDSAHNIGLDLALWAGLPLAFVWLAAMGLWLTRGIRGCNDSDSWAVLAAVGAVLVHAMVEYPLDHAYFLLPLGLLLGSLHMSSRDRESPATPGASPAMLAVPTLGLIVLLVCVGMEYLQVQQTHREVRLYLMGLGEPPQFEKAQDAVTLLDGPRELPRLMIAAAQEDMTAEDLDRMRKVVSRYAFPPAMLRYALAAGLNGRETEAALTLRRLCAMHPVERCDEARVAWRQAQTRWPRLGSIPSP